MSWDGKIERRNNPSDHDKLTQLVVLVKIQNGDVRDIKEDIKTVKTTITDHVKDDNKNFALVNWFIAIGVGIVVTLEFFLKK